MATLRVLIVSTDALIAALLGAWAEVEGMQPVYPLADRPLGDMLESGSLDLCIVDVDHPDGATPAFMTRARERDMPVVLFSPFRSERDVERRARASACPWFALPCERTRFAQIVDRCVGNGHGRGLAAM